MVCIKYVYTLRFYSGFRNYKRFEPTEGKGKRTVFSIQINCRDIHCGSQSVVSITTFVSSDMLQGGSRFQFDVANTETVSC